MKSTKLAADMQVQEVLYVGAAYETKYTVLENFGVVKHATKSNEQKNMIALLLKGGGFTGVQHFELNEAVRIISYSEFKALQKQY